MRNSSFEGVGGTSDAPRGMEFGNTLILKSPLLRFFHFYLGNRNAFTWKERLEIFIPFLRAIGREGFLFISTFELRSS